MTEIEEMQSAIRRFVNDRNWSQFHNLKDMLISLNLEFTEALEHVQWKTDKESQTQQVNIQTGFPDQKSDLPIESDKSTRCHHKGIKPKEPSERAVFRAHL